METKQASVTESKYKQTHRQRRKERVAAAQLEQDLGNDEAYMRAMAKQIAATEAANKNQREFTAAVAAFISTLSQQWRDGDTAESSKNERLEFVRRITRSRAKGAVTVKLCEDDDSLIMQLLLDVGDGKSTLLRALLDTGATISCIDPSVCKKHSEYLDQHIKTTAGIRVAMANAEQTIINQTVERVALKEKSTQKKVKIKSLHVMPLPSSIDIILGMDWMRQYKPRFDWDNNKVTYDEPAAAEDLHPAEAESVATVKKAPNSGEGAISVKAMRRIMKHS